MPTDAALETDTRGTPAELDRLRERAQREARTAQDRHRLARGNVYRIERDTPDDTEALAKARETLAKAEAVIEEAQALIAAVDQVRDERGGWNRYCFGGRWRGGKLHQAGCTRLSHEIDSDPTLADAAIATLATASRGDVCTRCLPDLAQHPQMQAARERAAQDKMHRAEARAQAAVLREAKKRRTGITNPDGTPLLDDSNWVIETIATAWIRLVDLVEWHHRGEQYEPTKQRIVTALAWRLERTEEDILNEVTARLERRSKRR